MLTRTCLLLAALCLSGCTVTKDLNTRKDALTSIADSSRETRTAAKKWAALALDSAAKTNSTAKASETATNETVEDITTTTYAAGTTQPATVTHTRRRVIGTAAKQSEAAAVVETRVQKHSDTKTDNSVTDALTIHSELKREAQTKVLVKKTTPALRAWLLAGGLTLLLLAGVWAAVPSLSLIGGGGPIWWLIGYFRRKKEQQPA